jgi:hypothetical protein
MRHLALSYRRDVLEDEFPGVDLKHLVDLVQDAEDAHVQRRAPNSLELTGCSCGVRYGSFDPYAESRAHLREAILVDVLRGLTGPCATCRGSGTWRKLTGSLTCPDCDGFGRTLFPLPPLQFRDEEGAVWQVTKTTTEGIAYVDQR